MGLIAWVVFKVNWKEVLFYIAQIKIWQVFLYLVIILAGIVISSHKWKLLVKFKGINLPFRDYFKLYLTGTFINNFMPSFIGGDAYRAYQSGKIEGKYTEAASAVMMDRITGMIGAMLLALFFAVLNLKTVLNNRLLVLANLLIIGSFVIDFVALKIRKYPKGRQFAEKYFPRPLYRFLKEVYHYSHHSGILIRTVFWAVVFDFVGVALANYILFLSLGISMNILSYLSVIFLISIVSSLPISINNIGVKEWAYVTFFGIFGIDLSIAVTAALLSRFLQMILSFFALPFYLRSRK